MISNIDKVVKWNKNLRLTEIRHAISGIIIVMPFIGNPGYGMDDNLRKISSEEFKKSLPDSFKKVDGIIGRYNFGGNHGVVDHATLTEITDNTLNLHLSVPVITHNNKDFKDESTPNTANHNYHIYYKCTLQEINSNPPFFTITRCDHTGTNIASHGTNTTAIAGAIYNGSVNNDLASTALIELIKAQNDYAKQQAEIAQKKAEEDKEKASKDYAKKTSSMKEDPDGEGEFYNPNSNKEINKIKNANKKLEDSIKEKIKKKGKFQIENKLTKEELKYYNNNKSKF